MYLRDRQIPGLTVKPLRCQPAPRKVPKAVATAPADPKSAPADPSSGSTGPPSAPAGPPSGPATHVPAAGVLGASAKMVPPLVPLPPSTPPPKSAYPFPPGPPVAMFLPPPPMVAGAAMGPPPPPPPAPFETVAHVPGGFYIGYRHQLGKYSFLLRDPNAKEPPASSSQVVVGMPKPSMSTRLHFKAPARVAKWLPWGRSHPVLTGFKLQRLPLQALDDMFLKCTFM